MFRRILTGVRLILVCIFASYPAAFIVLWLLWPLWTWVEASSGIETVGHFPWVADWLWYGVYASCLTLALAAAYARQRRSTL
jgi:hypothetical protein